MFQTPIVNSNLSTYSYFEHKALIIFKPEKLL